MTGYHWWYAYSKNSYEDTVKSVFVKKKQGIYSMMRKMISTEIEYRERERNKEEK